MWPFKKPKPKDDLSYDAKLMVLGADFALTTSIALLGVLHTSKYTDNLLVNWVTFIKDKYPYIPQTFIESYAIMLQQAIATFRGNSPESNSTDTVGHC